MQAFGHWKNVAFGQGLLTLTEKVQRTKKIICEV